MRIRFSVHTVIEFMGGEQVYIVVTEQPEEIIKSKSSA